MSRHNHSGGESNIPWWAIVLGFIFFWPVGLVLLILNMSGVRIPTDKIRDEVQNGWEKHSSSPYAPSGSAQTPPTAQASSYAGQTQSADAARSAREAGRAAAERARAATRNAARRRTPDPGRVEQHTYSAPYRVGKNPKSGLALTVVGIVLSSVFGLALGTLIPTFWGELFSVGAIGAIFPTFGFFCAGLVMLGMGLSRSRSAKRQRLYLGFIGRRTSVFLDDLAGATGQPVARVISDLQDMLSDGVLPMGYIDKASGRLVLTDQGYEPQPEAAPEQPSSSPDDDQAILAQIRAANDAIPDPEMSRKIDRIEEITGKILAYQRQNPAKAGQLRQFLNYYLPTTLKILNAYGQMDAQGIEGENIAGAKARIEGMMDKVVEGFEKQLDQLFQAEAMDITTDVDVLERMLDKDGLGGGMTMGG